MRVKIRGKSWTVREALLTDNLGECTWSRRLIELAKNQPPKQRLDTLIHEVAHAINWRWTEKRVCQIAKEITAVLWQDGYRRKTRKKKIRG
jgi:hypothetical protein